MERTHSLNASNCATCNPKERSPLLSTRSSQSLESGTSGIVAPLKSRSNANTSWPRLRRSNTSCPASFVAFVIEHNCNWLAIGRGILFEPYPGCTQPVREVETIGQALEHHALGIGHP